MTSQRMPASTARTFAVIAAALYPAWGLVMSRVVPGAVDPLWERLAVSALILSSWPLLGHKRWTGLVWHVHLALLSAHYGSLSLRNDFPAPYAIGQLVTLAAVGAGSSSRVFLAGLTTFFVVQPLLVTLPGPASYVLSFGAVTIGLVQWVVLSARMALLDELEASHLAERARKEKLQHVERLATLGTVAATVAHELNNPLAWLAGNLSYLNKELPAGGDPELSLAVRESLEGINQLTTIVRDLKLLARRDDKTSAPFDPCAVARGAATLVRTQVRQRAQFEMELGCGGVHVLGDGNRLAQVIINLLVNAAQATPLGAPAHHRVTLRLEAEERVVRILVSDTGPGIPPEIQAHIFEPFFTTKPAGEGTGLGLAVCKEAVASLGGTLTFQTSAAGTCFVVELPTCDEAPEVTPLPTPRLSEASRGLVIDDESQICHTIRRALPSSFHVVLCSSVDEGLAALRQNSDWDFVLCDVMMPGKTAVDLVERLDAEFPHVRSRLVLMTGGVFTERERKFLEHCDAPLLEKPFSASALFEAIERLRRPAAAAPVRQTG